MTADAPFNDETLGEVGPSARPICYDLHWSTYSPELSAAPGRSSA
ncbi:hypothetical protein ASAP_2319 [Asaia bogorensis]|uniref:Uncharacterized protein n=1 Tax=Asaia bogorensis TaxID=91915 RepID=A0A060QGU7_9PROT|nr:hypothetical protein ASAP_2319 [Asaia bogorensis]